MCVWGRGGGVGSRSRERRKDGKKKKKSLTWAAALGGPILEGMAVDCAFAGVCLCGLHILFSSSAPSPEKEDICGTLKSKCGAVKWQAAAAQLCLWLAAFCVCSCYAKA